MMLNPSIRGSRTLATLVLMGLAVGAPSLAWWLSGSHEADRDLQQLRQQVRRNGQQEASDAATRLERRLEQLRTVENTRPYYHYQNLYHDPRGASEGLSVVPSPLATRPADPLILAYFQASEDGRVTTPTRNEELQTLNAPVTGREQSVMEKLTAAGPRIVEGSAAGISALRAASASEQHPQPASRAPVHTAARRIVSAEKPPAVATKPDPPPAVAAPVAITDSQQKKQPVQGQQAVLSQQIDASSFSQNQNANEVYSNIMKTPVEAVITVPQPEPLTPDLPQSQRVQSQKVDSSSFAQNLNANVVYENLKKEPVKKAPAGGTIATPVRDVTVHTSDLDWQTIQLGERPALTAVRALLTPAGGSAQGFLVSIEALEQAAGGLRIVSQRPLTASGTTAAAAVGRTGWWVVVNERSALDAANQEGQVRRAAFRRSFSIALAATLLALLAVALMVWQGERVARDRARFAAAAAHELRTPIASLQLYGDMLAEQLGDPTRSEEYARRISEQASRLGRVVSNMLEFSRLEQGGNVVHPRSGDVGNVVRKLIEQLEPAIRIRGCAISLEIENDLPPAMFDRDALTQILENLVDNAEKYSRAAADRTIEMTVQKSAGGVSIEVADRGQGLPEALAGGTFRAFRRGPGADLPAGLGLGLSLAQTLANAQGSTLRARRREAGGTVFTLTLQTAA